MKNRRADADQCRCHQHAHVARRKRQGDDGHWHPVGCEKCSHTGYKGRTGVYELMSVSAQVQTLVHNRAAEQDLVAAARAAGLRSMREDGERLVRDGITSLEEVIRVTRD